MENKKTTELIDLLHKLVDKDGNLMDGHEEALEELQLREPFYTILHGDCENGIPDLIEKIEELQEEVKLLKRHKHDPKNSDVLVRI